MITQDLILPTTFQLKREGYIGNLDICSLNSAPLCSLRDDQAIRNAFPNQRFNPHPDFSAPPDQNFPDMFREVIASMQPRQLVLVAMPDQLHYDVVMEALRNDQHVLCVKPLVLTYRQAEEIRKIAYERGLFVGVEYHKRFDRRSLLARRHYQAGNFGTFRMAEAKMIEPYLYRSSNFQNWFTVENTDPFVYVGCHYVDLVYFITGLRPTALSVTGVEGDFPNGNRGYMWANGRVVFENGAVLSVIDGLGYPDDGAGSNEQCLTIFCEGENRGGMIKHNDQFRGVTHSYLDTIGPGGTRFNFTSPDFFQLVPWSGEGLKPVGYGPDSISAIFHAARSLEEEIDGTSPEKTLELAQRRIDEIDEKGIIATPGNSYINELVVEGARLSIRNDGRFVDIRYDGDEPTVVLR